jgi:GMP synthase (glutamine-hydrolysing)
MNDAAGLIVMGGSMSVYDHERFSFLLDEQHLIEQALKDEKPVLGVCLGSQLLAAILGAGVKKGIQKEIGWHQITLTEYATLDPLWKGVESRFMAYHWYGDIFELPGGAVSLASSELTPCQAFRYGETVYGFLFHMEVTEKIITDMVSAFQSELDEENINQASILQKAAAQLPKLQSIGEKVFRRWVRLIKLI